MLANPRLRRLHVGGLLRYNLQSALPTLRLLLCLVRSLYVLLLAPREQLTWAKVHSRDRLLGYLG